jgi:hypothetical protein
MREIIDRAESDHVEWLKTPHLMNSRVAAPSLPIVRQHTHERITRLGSAPGRRGILAFFDPD